MMCFCRFVSAMAVVVAASGVFGATYTNTVASGVTQTFSDMETAQGITISSGDTIVKKGPGILKVDSTHKIKCTVTVEEGIFDVTGLKMGNDGTVTVKKGACLYVSGNTEQMLNNWTYNVEGEGTGVSPYLGAIVINGSNGNGQLVHGTFNLKDDTTFYTCSGIINYMFSGTGSTAGPTLNMNSHTMTLKGPDTTAKFRARHKLAIRTTGPIVVDGMVYSRHKGSTDDYSPNIPSMKLVNGAIASVDGDYISKVNAFDCDNGTSLGYTSATTPVLGSSKSITATVKKIVGCPSVLSDTVLTLSQGLVVRGADLAVEHYLTAVNTFTFKEGCTLDVTDLGNAGLTSGRTFTVASSSEAISGTPTLTETAARYFTIANTGTAITLTVKGDYTDGGLLPGEENAAHNTAALETLNLTDGSVLVLSTGDYYFSGDFDLSSVAASNVTVTSLGAAVNVHATLKLGAASAVTIDRIGFKDCAGPAIVASGTAGLVIDNCTLDSVVGAWTVGEVEKKYPFVFTNVTDLNVKTPTYLPLKWKTWDAPALFDDGSQTSDSRVRAGELVVYCPPDLVYGGATGWFYWNYVTDYFGLNTNAYNGIKLVKLGNGTLDPGDDLAALGIAGVEIKEGQYVARDDNRLGKAKSTVKVHDGGCLCLAGGAKNIVGRTVEMEGNGVKSDQRSVRFTGTSIWNKTDNVIWKLTGDATMYDNVGSASNGNFLWTTFDMGGHTLTLTGKTGGVYRFGRWCNWKGGGKMIVDGVAIGASANDDNRTTPNMTAYEVTDGSHPQFVFKNKATLSPDTCELTSLMSDVDFATSDCTLAAKEGSLIPHDFVFARLAGVPAVSNVIRSVSVTSNYTAHVADLQRSKALTMNGSFVFGANATLSLDDLTVLTPSSTPLLVLTAAGGITGKPHPDDAAATAGWHVVKMGNSLYLRNAPGGIIVIR